MLTRARVALISRFGAGMMDDRTMNADSGGQPNGDNFKKSLQGVPRDPRDYRDHGSTGHRYRRPGYLHHQRRWCRVTRDIQNGAHYYTLSYTPSNEKMDGSFRRIEVKLPESKYKLAYRRGYYADSRPPRLRKPLQIRSLR